MKTAGELEQVCQTTSVSLRNLLHSKLRFTVLSYKRSDAEFKQHRTPHAV